MSCDHNPFSAFCKKLNSNKDIVNIQNTLRFHVLPELFNSFAPLKPDYNKIEELYTKLLKINNVLMNTKYPLEIGNILYVWKQKNSQKNYGTVAISFWSSTSIFCDFMEVTKYKYELFTNLGFKVSNLLKMSVTFNRYKKWMITQRPLCIDNKVAIKAAKFIILSCCLSL